MYPLLKSRILLAHDIAADYVEHGVDVTLFQRSETYIMSTKEGMPRVFGGMYPLHARFLVSVFNVVLDVFWEGAGPTEVGDRVHTSLPTFMLKEMHKRVTKDIAEADR